MIHLQWETTTSPERDAASPAGDAVSPEGDLLASPNFGMCDTTHNKRNYFSIQGELESQLLQANPILEGKKKQTQICKILNLMILL
jgi:hypothetical protein